MTSPTEYEVRGESHNVTLYGMYPTAKRTVFSRSLFDGGKFDGDVIFPFFESGFDGDSGGDGDGDAMETHATMRHTRSTLEVG